MALQTWDSNCSILWVFCPDFEPHWCYIFPIWSTAIWRLLDLNWHWLRPLRQVLRLISKINFISSFLFVFFQANRGSICLIRSHICRRFLFSVLFFLLFVHIRLQILACSRGYGSEIFPWCRQNVLCCRWLCPKCSFFHVCYPYFYDLCMIKVL